MRTLCIILIGHGVFFVQVDCRSAPLINGGAETGDVTGWTGSPEVVAVQVQDELAGLVLPFQGDWFFSFAGSPAANAGMQQSGSTDAGIGTILNFSGAYQVEFEDLAEAEVTLFDAGGTPVAQQASGPLSTPNLEWRMFSVLALVPESAASWTVELRGELFTGSFVNVFYDSLQLAHFLSADFDLDGDVDGDDFLSWQAGFGTGTTHAEGDADLDQDVDGDDFLTWQSQFGSGSGSASAAVPEPRTTMLLLVALIGTVFATRRH